METEELLPKVNDYLAKPYWPWPLAFAYSLPLGKRHPAVAAVVEVFEEYASSSSLKDFTASSAVALAYEVATGRKFKDDPVEDTGGDGEQRTIRSVESVYWEEVAELEKPLRGALQVGQIVAWGREKPDGRLVKIEPTDWVGAELDGGSATDLIRAGWREADILSQALNEAKRVVLFHDVHLVGAAVREWADARDKEEQIASLDDALAGDRAAFEEVEAAAGRVREGAWSPLVVAAWIASRSDSFVAAVQAWEQRELACRGGIYSSSAYLTVGNVMERRMNVSIRSALDALCEMLENGELEGGGALDFHSGKRRLIEPHEWHDGWSLTHETRGVSMLAGLYDFKWPSHAVRSAFPCENSAASAPSREQSLAAWADDAVSRGVAVADAKQDAVNHFGEAGAPITEICRELLRAARKRAGVPTKQGRRLGAKSWQKQAVAK